MFVTQVNQSDFGGGAAAAAVSLHRALPVMGHKSILFCRDRRTLDPLVKPVKRESLHGKVLEEVALSLTRRLGLQNRWFPTTRRMARWELVRRADVLHLHNLHGKRDFFDLTELPELTRRKPAVWTAHDMWAATGHCTVSAYRDCDKWLDGCGGCPSLDEYPRLERDTTARLWKGKKEIFADSNIVFVSPSKWLDEKLYASPLTREKRILRIPNGVDVEVFRPRPGAFARERFGIDKEAACALFVAPNVADPIKGASHLAAALEEAARDSKREVVLLVVGPKDFEWNASSYKVVKAGPVWNRRFLSACYNAADMAAVPSLVENFPFTAIEAGACGRPVVAFDTGGLGEIVRHEKTGYLAKCADAGDFAAGISRYLFDPAVARKAGEKAREVAENEFSVRLMAERYVRLYEELRKGGARA